MSLLSQRALWRAEGRELFVADLHLGKAEVFQAHAQRWRSRNPESAAGALPCLVTSALVCVG